MTTITNESQTVIALIGRFSPPHIGHRIAFDLFQTYSQNNAYIITAEPKKLTYDNPFTFEQKKELFMMMGVKEQFIKQMIGSAYHAPSILKTIGIDDPSSCRLIIGIGKKDEVRFFGPNRKTDGYYQMWDGLHEKQTADKHGYIMSIMNVCESGNIVRATTIRESLFENNYESIKEIYDRKLFDKAMGFLNANKERIY